MLRFRLHTKFLILVLGSLIVTLGVLSYVIVQREIGLLAKKADEKQHVLAFAIASDLANSMLEGMPRSTLKLTQSMRGALDLARLDVLRPDGTLAFGVPGRPVAAPEFRQAVMNGNEVHFFETGDPPVQTIIIPLMNETACQRCHAKSGPVLGAVLVSLSREGTIKEILSSKRDLTSLFAFIILLIGTILYLVIRSVILRPLALLHDGVERIGSGDLAHRIGLSTNDELQELAQAFNVMTGRIENSHADLEARIRERTVQLRQAMDDVADKADRLYTYGRNMAVISRLSTKVFNAELTFDNLLDRFLRGVTRGLGYERTMLCLVDRARVWLNVERDTGLGDIVPYSSRSLLSDDRLTGIIRNGKTTVVEEGDPLLGPVNADAGPRTVFVIPLLNRSHTKMCWQLTSCIKTDCPAHHQHDASCWLMDNTLCGNPLIESYGNKLAYCMTCKVFPVMGALIVAADRDRSPLRRRQLGVLRILTAEMTAALDNHRLHEENEHMVRELIELHRVTAAALSDLSLTRALDAFTDSALKFSGLDACSFWMLSPDHTFLEWKAGGRSHGGDVQDLCTGPLPVDAGLLGKALNQTGFVIDYNIAKNDPGPFSKAATLHGLNAVLAVSLKREGKPIGVFAVYKKSTLPFLETEIAAFMLLANQSAMAISVCLLNEELKGQNVELSRRTNLLSGLLSSMSSGVMLLSNDGTVKLVNLIGSSILRTTIEDLMEHKLTDLFPETDVFLQQLNDPYQQLEIRLNDNVTVPIGFTTTRFQGAEGEREGVIVVYRDLTEIKSLQTELLNKERFAAMGRVVAGVAHEIRNPLFGISSIGQIFERELTHPGHRDLVRALLAETRRMNQLVEELLIYGKPIKLNLGWCNLVGLWNEVISMHHEEFERLGIRISTNLGIGQVAAYLDANQIRQVFLNLIRNSIDALPSGGEISIRILIEDRHIIFRVFDTGVGIPAAHLDKIFDLFFSTKPKGTGLGLGICRKIVQDHGGDINVESKEGMGTAVTVTLPYRGKMDQREQ